MSWFTLRVSPNFTLTEFVCKCNGQYASCDRSLLHAGLVAQLEALRARYYPNGLTVVSGYRCNDWNKRVKGASSSQHLYGTACDIPPAVSATAIQRMNLFSGIGINRASGLVVHVDVRHLGPENTLGSDKKTKASPTNPAVWYY